MAGNMSGSASPVMIGLPGYGNMKSAFQDTDETKLPAAVYKIPPVVWPVLLLLVGYFGVRYIMED